MTATVATTKPFTVAHFKAWASELVLDNEETWRLEPFQVAFLRDLFAGRLENWLVLPEGNGKTTLIAGLVLYHCEFTPHAWVPVAASSRDQAEILYRQAEGFVLRTKRLHKMVRIGRKQEPLFECQEGYRRIKYTPHRSRIQIFAAEPKTGDGVIPSMAIVEELHRHKDLTLYRTWRGKMRKRKRAQLVTISTAGEPYSDFEETREKIRQLPGAVQKGKFIRACSDQIVLHDWANKPEDDVTDMRVVKLANPFSGVSAASLAEDFKSPTMTMQHWRRFKCNLPTRSSSAAIDESEWEGATSPESIPARAPIRLGIDVGWRTDTTALVPLWVRDRNFRLLGPAVILEPPKDGTTLHPDRIKDAVRALQVEHPIESVTMDAYSAMDIAAWLEDELKIKVHRHSQADAQAATDYELFMEALRNARLWHSADPGLTQHVLSADARLLISGKHRFERASRERRGGRRVSPIDALVAGAMVHSTYAAPIDEKPKTQRWGAA